MSQLPPLPCDDCANDSAFKLLTCLACRADARKGDGFTCFKKKEENNG